MDTLIGLPWNEIAFSSFLAIMIILFGRFVAMFVNEKWWPLHEDKERDKIGHEKQLFEILTRVESVTQDQYRELRDNHSKDSELVKENQEKIIKMLIKVMEAIKVNELLDKLKSHKEKEDK